MNNKDYLLSTPAALQWQKIGIRSHQGVATPLFSLRTKNSAGIGEFLDLKPFIDWLSALGFDVIMLLPLYASGNDPSPYNGLSANALNPIYISLYALPGIEKHKDILKQIEELKTFSKTERVQYQQLKELKEKLLRIYFEKEFAQFKNLQVYQIFTEQNLWLKPYATFKALKQRYQGTYWREWPKDPDLSSLTQEIEFHSFLQYLAYEQMKEVKKYAESKNIFLKGDIPILVSPDSADVWSNPDIFLTHLSAGGPPDMYNKEGQRWGFPLYNYENLEKQHFQFWKERLQTATTLFHLYRIDHIVGFFRIWAIPEGKKAKEGFFIPEDKAQWIPQGEKMLKMMLADSPMLPIGEDLGVIPPETRQSMHRFGIPGTKIMRWERAWETDRSFIPFDRYPIDSMTSVSTHDSEPLVIWWKDRPEESKEFARFMNWQWQPLLSRDNHAEILYSSHHTSSLFHINLMQEYLGLFPELTWGNSEKERINIPGVISPLNWTFRYRPSIEEMASHPSLGTKMKALIQ